MKKKSKKLLGERSFEVGYIVRGITYVDATSLKEARQMVKDGDWISNPTKEEVMEADVIGEVK